MAKSKKFGAFSGVFTPSVLTILGVIMYLRLGWVVGQAGLFWTIIIILIAHVISVSTGLSVSSISTDKKVQAGGLYYILSRSLGLPIGGAIGITLFVGTALSIALYVIGFSESFLDFIGMASGYQINEQALLEIQKNITPQMLKTLDLASVNDIIAPLKNSLELQTVFSDQNTYLAALKTTLKSQVAEQQFGTVQGVILANSHAVTVNDLRLVGTATVIFVTTIAFISTSFALKTQFFIMAAIVLSLVAIFMGNRDFAPKTPALITRPDGSDASFGMIFGIFFPAVTGFTAGVAMSGDLKDPKKNIPSGTMLAIGVGLIVYIILAIFLTFTIDPATLRNNSNILKEIAFISPGFVLAGIWGATLSSALGGILGAPRILQAMSVDKITPKVFGKGVGQNNEPRNALILTFVIAEAGVLIGELNAIAQVVSMFYLAAYGFINLSAFLESWASPDFRPTFKIPKFVSLTGFGFTMFVMIALDFTSMVVAFVIIGAIFVYLVRKQISLGFGDVWEGVWASVVRRGLYNIVKKETKQRNWRPNIIMFSGGEEARPHLVKFGKTLVGRLGFLSDFHLVESRSADVVFSKPQQFDSSNLNGASTDSTMGFFTRKQDCVDLYDGMENIARTYGFSGLDPNTVLMGWGSDAEEPVKFISFVHNLIKLDYNILLMDYNQDQGFGKFESIDIWWRGKGFNVNLTLTLLKFIQASDDWRKAKIRCLIVSEGNLNQNRVYKNTTLMLDEMRIDAEVKLISNEVHERPYQEIINHESANADLVILGLPEINSRMDFEFYENTNQLIAQINKTAILVKSSSYFQTSAKDLGITIEEVDDNVPETSVDEYRIPELILPERKELAEIVTQLQDELRTILLDYSQQYINPNYAIDKKLTMAFREIIKQCFAKIKEEAVHEKTRENIQTILDTHLSFLQQSSQLIEGFIEEQLKEKHDNLIEGTEWLYKSIGKVIADNPKMIPIKYERAFFEQDEKHQKLVKNLNRSNRLKQKLSKKPLTYHFKHHRVLEFYVQTMGQKTFAELYKDFDRSNVNYNASLQELLRKTSSSLDIIEKYANTPSSKSKQLPDGQDQSSQNGKPGATFSQDAFQDLVDHEYEKIKDFILEITNDQREKVYKYNHILLLETQREIQEISQNFDSLETNQVLRKNRKEFKKARKLKNNIDELPDLWKHNQALVTKTTLIDAKLLSFRKQLQRLLKRFEQDLSRLVEKNVVKPLNILERFLDNFDINDEAQYKAWAVRTQYAVDLDGYFKQSVDKFLDKLKHLMSEYSETIDMISEESLSSLETEELEELESTPVFLNRLLDYLVQQNLIEPLLDYTQDLPRKLQRASNMTNEVKRMLSFHIGQLQNTNELKQNDIKIQIKELLAEEKQQIDKERQEIDLINQQTSNSIDNIWQNIVGKLSPYVISRSASNANQYIRTRENKTRLSRVGSFNQRVQTGFRNGVTRFWYRRSEGILLAKQLQKSTKDQDSLVESILNLVERISPKAAVTEHLPVYYNQLFTHKNTFGEDFWIGRKPQLEQAKKAVKRFKEGFGGALMITGDYNSGRTFLSQHIAEQNFPKRFVHFITPPEQGSIDVMDFKRAFENGVGFEGEYPEIFAELNFNTVLVFNDLELWWERSPQGWKVLDELLDLIDTYSEQCFFILNINRHALRFINMVKKIENYFLATIQCEPFNAEALKDIILFRHRSSPITFKWKGNTEKDLSNWKYARLMSKYFDYSQGNVGIALQAWIAHIEEVNEGVLTIREPVNPNTDILRQLPEEWMIWIVQFILHKHLTLDRLIRITQEDERVVYNKIRILKRAGIIKETSKNLLKINQYLEFHLINELTNLGVI